jgi:H+/Cl- antiporter ClcA
MSRKWSFAQTYARWPWSPFLITPAGFALSAYLTRRFFQGAQGSGIPQVMAARQLERTDDRARLVSPRLGVAKIALLMLSLLSGASSGREGPTVQVGAATMFRP